MLPTHRTSGRSPSMIAMLSQLNNQLFGMRLSLPQCRVETWRVPWVNAAGGGHLTGSGFSACLTWIVYAEKSSRVTASWPPHSLLTLRSGHWCAAQLHRAGIFVNKVSMTCEGHWALPGTFPERISAHKPNAYFSTSDTSFR
jgi:hypothetical protein